MEVEGSPVAAEEVNAGWYPAQHGTLRYWDGTAWTDHYAPTPTGPDSSSARTARRTQVLGIIAVAVITCLLLVALAAGVMSGSFIDDSQPVITLTPSVR